VAKTRVFRRTNMANDAKRRIAPGEKTTDGVSKEEGEIRHVAPSDDHKSLMSSAVLIGAMALLEPELLVGMAIGAGIVLASGITSSIIGDLVRPVVKTTVKTGYAVATMAREMVAEATEEVQDAVAEARAEHEAGQTAG